MKPHMTQIKNTLERKQKTIHAGNKETTLRKYRDLVEKALASGYDHATIVEELQAESTRIQRDAPDGDSLFQDGVRRSKQACVDAILEIISELKGEPS